MNQSIVRRTAITLSELPTGGWLHREYGKHYRSLVAAVRGVNRDSKRMTSSGGGTASAVVTVIEYHPCSAAGRAALKALTGEDAK